MNDTELDELLDQWQVPAPSPKLREGVQAGFAVVRPLSPRRRSWTDWLPRFRIARVAAVLAGTMVLLIGATQALPQSLLFWPLLPIPYTVKTEYTSYAADGSVTRSWSVVSYFDQRGREVVLSNSAHARHWTAPLLESAQMVGRILSELMRPLAPNGGRSDVYDALVRSGCETAGGVAGHETLLGYPTTVTSYPSAKVRLSQWSAPSLGCFPLRLMVEDVRPDGSSRLRLLREAIRVDARH